MDIFQALADPTRRSIIGLLKDSTELSTSTLTKQQNISRQAINKHLNILIENNIVLKRQVGKNCIHTLNPNPLKKIDQWLKPYAKLWDQRLVNLQNYLGE